MGLEHAFLAVFGVHEGNVESMGVKKLGELQQGVYVPLRWERDQNDMRLC